MESNSEEDFLKRLFCKNLKTSKNFTKNQFLLIFEVFYNSQFFANHKKIGLPFVFFPKLCCFLQEQIYFVIFW